MEKSRASNGGSHGKITPSSGLTGGTSPYAFTLDGCKVNHLLRGSDCTPHLGNVADLSAQIIRAFEDIVGCGLNEQQQAQAALPIATGGCGLKLPTDLWAPARMAALASYFTTGCRLVWAP